MPKQALTFDRITPSARTKLLMDVQFFLSEHPEWNEPRLLKVAKMDWRLLNRIREGKTFTTRAGDRLQEVMEAIMRGEIKAVAKVRKRRRPNGFATQV